MSSPVSDAPKRVMTDEHKLKMKEGREKAAAEKAKAELDAIMKLKNDLEKKIEKMTSKETNADPPTEEAPLKKKSLKEKPAPSEEDPIQPSVEEPKPAPKKQAKKPAEAATEVPAEKPKKESVLPLDECSGCGARGVNILSAKSSKCSHCIRSSSQPERLSAKPVAKVPPTPVVEDDSEAEESTALFVAKKKSIPKHVKTLVWNKYIGSDKAKAPCMSCRQEEIGIRSFHCGHVIAEAKGGDMTINNLRPICAACNSSMGTMSMNEFTSQFFGWSI